MRAPVVQGAQVNTALAELLKSTVTLPGEEADVLQVGVDILHHSFTMMHMLAFFELHLTMRCHAFSPPFLLTPHPPPLPSFPFSQSFINLSADY